LSANACLRPAAFNDNGARARRRASRSVHFISLLGSVFTTGFHSWQKGTL